MASGSLRRKLIEPLFVNLALLLGGFQVLVWHWWQVVVLGRDGPSAAALLGAVAALVALNRVSVPLLRRHRRRSGWLGRVARAYMNLGVVTLLLGLAIALMWLVFLLPAALIGAFGGGGEWAFGGFRVASVGLVGFVAFQLAWGFSVGQAVVARSRVRVGVPGLAADLGGLRIAQISDLHIGNGLEGQRLARMVELVNAEEPDLIAVTGDIFDFDPAYVEDGARALAGLRARHGVYAILGNHDIYTGADRIAEALARRAPNVRLLRDELVPLPLRSPLYLAGSEDPGRGWATAKLDLASLAELASKRPSDGPTLLLVHRPALFDQAARLGFPLVLAGHTHGGQLALPTPSGHWNLARLVGRLTRGLYRQGGSTLYVNRGLGVGGPSLRINCTREIAIIELHAC